MMSRFASVENTRTKVRTNVPGFWRQRRGSSLLRSLNASFSSPLPDALPRHGGSFRRRARMNVPAKNFTDPRRIGPELMGDGGVLLSRSLHQVDCDCVTIVHRRPFDFDNVQRHTRDRVFLNCHVVIPFLAMAVPEGPVSVSAVGRAFERGANSPSGPGLKDRSGHSVAQDSFCSQPIFLHYLRKLALDTYKMLCLRAGAIVGFVLQTFKALLLRTLTLSGICLCVRRTPRAPTCRGFKPRPFFSWAEAKLVCLGCRKSAGRWPRGVRAFPSLRLRAAVLRRLLFVGAWGSSSFV